MTHIVSMMASIGRSFLALFILLSLKTVCFSRILNSQVNERCRFERSFYDSCERHCVCDTNLRVTCCRVRREFTDMSNTDRRRYITAVKTATTHSNYKSKFNTFIGSHKRLFFARIHDLEFFLPWHRWYLLQYENILQEIDCRVTVPYWDWSLVGAMPFTSDLWNEGSHGFGGNGSGNQSCVRTGPFRVGELSLVSDAGGGCLARNFTGRAPDSIAVRKLLVTKKQSSKFLDFEQLLRREFHDPIHCLVGGTMCSLDSAAAPVFFLHHGFIDKIWHQWQTQSSKHMFPEYFMRQTTHMPNTKIFAKEVLDLNNQTGSVCAKYIEPRNGMFEAVQELTKSKIRRLARLPLALRSLETEELFHTTPAEQRKEKSLRRTISPVRILHQSSLYGHDAIQGFRTMDLRSILDFRKYQPDVDVGRTHSYLDPSNHHFYFQYNIGNWGDGD